MPSSSTSQIQATLDPTLFPPLFTKLLALIFARGSLAMKKEQQSPVAASLAARIAKYAYATPSPSKPGGQPINRTPTREGNLSIASPRSTRSARSLTSEARPRSSARERVRSPVTISPYFSSRPGGPSTQEPGGTSSYHVASDDDLESISDGLSDIESPRKRRRVDQERINGRRREAAHAEMKPDGPESESSGSSGGGSDFEGVEDEEEDPDSSQSGAGDVQDEAPQDRRGQGQATPRRQTRIPTRRAGRADRFLLPDPTPATFRSSRTRSTKRNAEAVKVEEDTSDAGPSRRKSKGKKPRAYADPETYQHLRPLPDLLAPDLDCGSSLVRMEYDADLTSGVLRDQVSWPSPIMGRREEILTISPGLKSSKSGHHFAHPTNKFWASLL